jgi:hypothetical protein
LFINYLYVYLERTLGSRIFGSSSWKQGVIPMEKITDITSAIAGLDTAVLPFVVVLAAIGLCAMALWTVLRLSSRRHDK